jgi:hypothetical protein
MSGITVAAPPLTYVSWGCRRCGFTGGIARTTIPLDASWSEAMGRTMFATLRQKLIRVHMKRGCIATRDDFTVRPYEPRDGKQIVGTI